MSRSQAAPTFRPSPNLGHSDGVVRTMRTAPVTRDAVLRLAAATVVPMVPLLLTMLPLAVKKLFANGSSGPPTNAR